MLLGRNMTPKKDDDDLVGFRDFIDGESEKPKIAKKRRDNNSSGFELLTFLESESKRLELHSHFFEEKAYMLKNHPQGRAINFELDKELNENLDTLTRMLMKSDSSLCSSINEILKQFKVSKN